MIIFDFYDKRTFNGLVHKNHENNNQYPKQFNAEYVELCYTYV